MQQNKKQTVPAKMLALCLSVMMILTLFAMPVFAADTETKTCKVTVTDSAASEDGNVLQVFDNDTYQDVIGEAEFEAGTVISCAVQAYGSDVKLTIVHNGISKEKTIAYGDSYDEDIALEGDLSITAEVATAPEMYKISIKNESAIANTDYGVNALHVVNESVESMPDLEDGAELEKGTKLWIYPYNYVTPVQFTVKQNGEILCDKTVEPVLEGGYEEIKFELEGDVEVTCKALCTINFEDKVQSENVQIISNAIDDMMAEESEVTPLSDGSVVFGGYMVGTTIINDSKDMLKLTAVNPADETLIDEVLIAPADAYGIVIPQLSSHVKFTLDKATADLDAAEVLAATQTYTGKALQPALKVTAKINGQDVVLKNGTDYTAEYKNNINAGEATVTVTGKGNYIGTITKEFTIAKAAQNLKVTQTKKQKTITLKQKALKKAAKKLAFSKAAKVSGNTAKLSYKKTKGNKSITVDKKTGKITVKKGLKKGTYKIAVKVSAAGNNNYNAADKNVTFTVKVK